MSYYYDISACNQGKGFITHEDRLAIPGVSIDGSVAVMDGDMRDIGPWATRVGAVPLSNSQRDAYLAGKLKAGIVTSTQARLDSFAQTRNYDGILSACTYATSSVPTFAAEGQYCITARDNTWATLYTIMAEVEAGTRTMPTSYADVEPLLPALTWPA